MDELTHEEKMTAAYRDALQVQDACNLSGVVFSWARHMQTICDEAQLHGTGTDWKNRHPVNVLFASKVASLTGSESPTGFSRAYEAALTAAEADAKRQLCDSQTTGTCI